MIREKLKKIGINYLINVGPDHLGRFPLQAQEILRKVAKLDKNKKVYEDVIDLVDL